MICGVARTSTVGTRSLLRSTKALTLDITRNKSDERLKDVMRTLIPAKQEEIREFRRSHGSKVLEEITIDMVYSGMREIKSLVTETSHLDPNEGIRYRGYTLHELQGLLPKASYGGESPLPEAAFWLLLTGEIPSQEDVEWLSHEFYKRSALPKHVFDMVKSFPKDLHPMAQFSAAMTALHGESEFTSAYHQGVRRSSYWEYTYEDALSVIARSNTLASLIYCQSTGKPFVSIPMEGDFAKRFAQRIDETDEQFIEYLRLYFFTHADHEGGNASAHTCHLVGSALSDPYLSFGAALCGLAGPLHGLANQETVNFINRLLFKYPNPTDSDIESYLKQALRNGQVIPGCGHAVLRVTDPRFTLLADFGSKHLSQDKRFNISKRVMEIAPRILIEAGKAKNPWPNVDAISGSILWHYGFTNTAYYTVLFGMSRTLGTMASLIWDRALELPLERPKSLTTPLLKQLVGAK